jgi:hypothetical protein
MRRAIVAISIALASLVGTIAAPHPVEAGAPNASQGTYRIEQRLCNSPDGIYADIGGRVFIKEFGKQRVRRFKVKWLLYQRNPSGLNTSLRRKEYTSPYFPNDARNFWWRNSHTWKNVVIPDQGLKLVVKLTWDRVGRRDWNEKVLVAYCG